MAALLEEFELHRLLTDWRRNNPLHMVSMDPVGFIILTKRHIRVPHDFITWLDSLIARRTKQAVSDELCLHLHLPSSVIPTWDIGALP